MPADILSLMPAAYGLAAAQDYSCSRFNFQQGRIMQRTGFALAFLAAIAMTVMPVVPSSAASPKQDRAAAQQALATPAEQGDVIVLSPAQMEQLVVSNPALHAKLATAQQTGQAPSLSPAEKSYVASLTQENVDQIKAGDPSTAGWIIIGVSVVALLALFGNPAACSMFPWAIGCVKPAVAAPAKAPAKAKVKAKK